MKIQVKITAILIILAACGMVIACFGSDDPDPIPYPWTVISSGSNPTAAPHNGSYMAAYDSWDASAGSQARLYRNSGFAITGGSTAVTLTFYMYHSTDYTNADQVQIQVSTDGGTTWTPVGSAILRYDGTTGWMPHTLDLTAYEGQTVILGFLATSAYGEYIYLDDVLVTGETPTATYLDDGFETAFPGDWLNKTF